jgi:membrane-bound ClpP family serine protease
MRAAGGEESKERPGDLSSSLHFQRAERAFKMRLRHALNLVLAVLLAAALGGLVAADTYKNKTTGEMIKGKLTDNKINDTRVFRLDTGGNKFIKPEEWELVEADKPVQAATTPTGDAATATTASTDATKTGKTSVYVLPIQGPIESKALVRAVARSLEDAKKRKAQIIVLHLDTPGGRIDVANDVIDLIERVDWARTVAWVEGGVQKGAMSAGAYISLAAEQIYMAPGTLIGAAVPFTESLGSYEVDEKFQSAFRARFRALAQKRGHPVRLADAMVDTSTSVVQVFVDGQQQLVSEEEALQLRRDHAQDGKYRRGKTVVAEGKILTLTADEALEYGLAKAKAANMKELMAKMEITDFSAYEPEGFTQALLKLAIEDRARFEKHTNAIDANLDQADLTDPAAMSWTERPGSSAWRAQAKRSMAYVKAALAALTELEKMANDPNCSIDINKEIINTYKTKLNTRYQRLGADAR